MTKFGFHVKLKAQAGKGSELKDIMMKASELVSNLEGCLLYIISQDQDKDSVWITEVWKSKEDHSNSLMVDEIHQFISKARPILSPDQEIGQELQVIGGYGLN